MNPPKIITLQAPTHRDRRTLEWVHGPVVQSHPTPSTSRWDTVVTGGYEEYRAWKDARGGAITYWAVLDPNALSTELFDVYQASKEVSLIFVPQVLLEKKSQDYWDENFENVMCLDQLHDSYPFLGGPWNGTAGDAVRMIAVLCRYHVLVNGPRDVSLPRELRQEWGTSPAPLWLFTQFFTSPTKARRKEILTCLRRNAACPWVDRVVLLNETDESAAWASFSPAEKSKIVQVVIGRRLRYGDFLRYVASTEVPAGAIVALCNADIYLDKEAAELWSIDLDAGRMLALLRWDDLGDGPAAGSTALFGPRADSQDAWILSSTAVKERGPYGHATEILLGQPGCDNAFAGVMLRHRFLISNPALTVKTYHLHNSNVRTYAARDTIRAELYINLVPTYVMDTRQEIVPKGAPVCICNELVSFEVKSTSLSNEITYCTMLEKEGRYKWEAQVENHLFEPAIPVYRWLDGHAVTPNGLVYDLYSIYTGKYAMTDHPQSAQFQYWKDANVDLFTPMHSVDRMIAIPLENARAVFSQYDRYLLYYMGRVLRVLHEYPQAAFWVPIGFEAQVARDFPFLTTAQRLPYDGVHACWSKEVVGFVPSPSVREIAREEVAGLRQVFTTSGMPASASRILLIQLHEAVGLTRAYVEQFLMPLFPEWTLRIADGSTAQWSDVSLFIGYGDRDHSMTADLWRLPAGARVIEFQQELKIYGETLHLCFMADLKPWVFLLSKGSVVDVQDQMTTQIAKWWKKNPMKE